MRIIMNLAALALTAGLAGVAAAQTQVVEEHDTTYASPGPRARAEAFAGIGGGAFNQDLGDVTGGAFAFNARIGIDGVGRARWLGAEAAYQGIRANSDISNDNVYNGILGGNLRLNAPLNAGRGVLKPYVLGGLAWSRINANNTLTENDNSLAVPLGGGISYFWNNGFGLDGRFVYNILTGERAPVVIQTGDSWNVALNAGGRWGF